MKIKTMYPVIQGGKIIANGGNYVDDIYSNADDLKKKKTANAIKNIADTTGDIASIFAKNKRPVAPGMKPQKPAPTPSGKKGMSQNMKTGLIIGIPLVIIGGLLLWKKFGKKG